MYSRQYRQKWKSKKDDHITHRKVEREKQSHQQLVSLVFWTDRCLLVSHFFLICNSLMTYNVDHEMYIPFSNWMLLWQIYYLYSPFIHF